MSRVIWKYEVGLEGEFTLLMPAGAQVIHVDVQNDRPVFWAVVDTHAEKERRQFVLIGTGFPEVESGFAHCGTFQWQRSGGVFVGHLFEILS